MNSNSTKSAKNGIGPNQIHPQYVQEDKPSVYFIDPSESAKFLKTVDSAGRERRNPNRYEFRKWQTLVELP